MRSDPCDKDGYDSTVWRHSALSLVLFLFMSCALTAAFPGIDLTVSRWFFDTATGGWPVAQSPIWQVARQTLWRLADLTWIAAVVVLVLRVAIPRWRHRGRAAAGLITLSYLLGPGLVVNLLLKEHWGRARPFQTSEFGGDHLFTPALTMTDQCAHNCSFVGGEASSYAVLFFVLFFMFRAQIPVPHGWKVLTAALFVAVFGSLLRVAFGHHFLSDIVFAWAAMFAVVVAITAAFDLLKWDYRWPSR